MKQMHYKPRGEANFLAGQGHVSLDFTIPEHEAFFYDRFGGKEYVRTNYPLVYEACERTKLKTQKQHEGKAGDSEEEPDLIPIQTGLDPVTYSTGSISHRQGEADNETVETMVDSAGWIFAKKPLPYVSLIGCLQNITQGMDILDSFAFSDDSRSSGKSVGTLSYLVSDLMELNDQKLQSTMEYYYVTESGEIKTDYGKSETFVCEGFKQDVELFQLEDPSDKSGKKNTPMIILYGRNENEGETADYKYPDNGVDSNGRVALMFPLKGTFTFSDKCFPIGYSSSSKSSGIYFFLEDKGAVYFKHDKDMPQFFEVDSSNQHILHFSLPADWNDRLHTSNFGVGTTMELRASMYIAYYGISADGQKVKKELPVSIRSKTLPYEKYFSANGPSVGIPYVSVRWGCFAADTRLTLQDGREKCVCDIHAGDCLRTASGSSVKVTGMLVGAEKELVTIETEQGSLLRVSKTHPVITTDGIRQARDITTKDQILNAAGKPEPVKFAYLCEYDGKVYNPETDGPEGNAAILIANGLQAGDAGLQNQTSPIQPKEPQKPLTPEVQALVEEMKRMMEETFR